MRAADGSYVPVSSVELGLKLFELLAVVDAGIRLSTALIPAPTAAPSNAALKLPPLRTAFEIVPVAKLAMKFEAVAFKPSLAMAPPNFPVTGPNSVPIAAPSRLHKRFAPKLPPSIA